MKSLGSAWITAGLLVIASVTIQAQQPAQPSVPPPASVADVDRWVRAEMESRHIPGVALAVVKNGKVIKLRGYGYANLEHKIPVTGTTVFKIGSVSKQFIATGIMLLAQDGKLRPEDEVSKYLLEAPPTWSGMNHTSGIVREGPAADDSKAQLDSVVIGSVLSKPLDFAPGQKWQYCNVCYFTLADVIRRVSGQPWSAFLQERVFEPAGMRAT